MFCRNCGFELSAEAKFCPCCGTTVEAPGYTAAPNNVPPQAPTSSSKPSVKGLVGFGLAMGAITFYFIFPILSLVLGIVGLVFSILGLKETNANNLKLKGFPLAGLIVSIVAISLAFLSLVVACSVYSALNDFYYYY